MKKLIAIIAVLVSTISLNAQNNSIGIGDTIKLTTSFYLWKTPANISIIKRLSSGTEVVLLSFDKSYYNISVVGDTIVGYLLLYCN